MTSHVNKSILEWAKQFADKGIFVFPVAYQRKTPLIEWTKNSTTVEGVIEKWFSEPMSPNIGIDCGPSKLVIIDLDTYKTKYKDTELALDENTVISRTPRGGLHYWYRTKTAYSSKNRNFPEGIDVRSSGGYIVAPPSYVVDEEQNIDGSYEFLEGHSLDEIAIACVPQEIEKLLIPVNTRVEEEYPEIQTVKYSQELLEKVEQLSDCAYEMLTGGYEKWFGSESKSHDHSEMDFGLICELLKKGFSKDEILTLLENSELENWKEKTSRYKNRTLHRADKDVEENFSKTPTQKMMDILQRKYDIRLCELEDSVEIDGEIISDISKSFVNNYMHDQGFKNRAVVKDVVFELSSKRKYHPIKDYFNGLEWDGTKRVNILIDCFKMKLPLEKVLMKKWLLGCIATIFTATIDEPHKKHQNPMLVFAGAQGIGKSTFCEWLAIGVGYEYFKEGSLSHKNPEHTRDMCKHFIWEVSELGASVRAADREELKSFLTTKIHTYRVPYYQYPLKKPTTCNLVGTINSETGFLNDPTGNRRFWPCEVESIDISYQELDVNQLWAELFQEFKDGIEYELTDDEKLELKEIHKEHTVENPLEDYIFDCFEFTRNEEDWVFTIDIIQHLRGCNVNLHKDDAQAAKHIAEVLLHNGLDKPKNKQMGGRRAKGYSGIKPKVPTGGR